MAKRRGKDLFLLLMLVQILAGLVWGVQNVGHMARFHDTQLFIRAAETMIIDEYMGILYPLLIAFAKTVEEIIGIPFYSLLYILQLGCAFGVMVLLLKHMEWIKVRGRKGNILVIIGALYGVTFPLLMQLHMAVLPYSLAWSALVLLIDGGIGCLLHNQGLNGKGLIRICGLWLVSYLLLPEYGALAGISVCMIFFEAFRRDKKSWARLVMALLSTVLCFGVAAKSTQVPGSMGRMQKTVGAAMVNRFVWPYFLTNSFFWDERVKETFDSNDLLYFAGYPEAVLYEFGPALEEKYGKKAANEIYWDMAKKSFKLETKQSVSCLTGDTVANICPQGALLWQLNGGGSTLNGWNYSSMQENSPWITKYYVRYSLIGWLVMSAVGVMILIGKRYQKFQNSRSRENAFQAEAVRIESMMQQKMKVRILLSCLVPSALWYTMSSSMQDYKKVMFCSFVWILFVIKIVIGTDEVQEEE